MVTEQPVSFTMSIAHGALPSKPVTVSSLLTWLCCSSLALTGSDFVSEDIKPSAPVAENEEGELFRGLQP